MRVGKNNAAETCSLIQLENVSFNFKLGFQVAKV